MVGSIGRVIISTVFPSCRITAPLSLKDCRVGARRVESHKVVEMLRKRLLPRRALQIRVLEIMHLTNCVLFVKSIKLVIVFLLGVP